jgi:hypothetical protein
MVDSKIMDDLIAFIVGLFVVRLSFMVGIAYGNRQGSASMEAKFAAFVPQP